MFLVIFNVTLIRKLFLLLPQMKNNTLIYKKSVSAFLASVCIFSVILVGFFHKHTSGFNVSSNSFTESSSSNKTIFYANEDGCYSIHNSQVLVGDIHQLLDFQIDKPIIYREIEKLQLVSTIKAEILFSSLRAPPYTI